MNPLVHLRRNLVAYLALFAALGTGTAYAAGKITGKDIASNAIRAKHIKDGQVRGPELAVGAVSGAKVADDSLTGADIDESTLQLPPAPSTPSVPAGPGEPDLSGFAKVLAKGFLTGPGPLKAADRCNSVGTEVPGVNFADQVVIAPGSLTEEVTYEATVTGLDHIAYQACYTGSGEVFIGADVHYMVLRTQE
jgi:hypothetical protein